MGQKSHHINISQALLLSMGEANHISSDFIRCLTCWPCIFDASEMCVCGSVNRVNIVQGLC